MSETGAQTAMLMRGIEAGRVQEEESGALDVCSHALRTHSFPDPVRDHVQGVQQTKNTCLRV